MIHVIGASIAGMLLAERLHRRGKQVTLLSGGPPEAKRLTDGCSLRRSTIDAFNLVFEDDLWADLGKGTFDGTGVEGVSPDGTLVKPRMHATLPKPVGLSTRHGHILSVLRKRLTVPQKDGFVTDLPDGLVLNTLAKPFLATPRAPKRWVLATQIPCIGKVPPVGFAPMLGNHLGFVTPFDDPATPRATHYIINTTVTTDPSDAALAEVERVMFLMAKAYDLQPVEVEATLGRAKIPVCEDFTPIPASRPDVVNLYDAFSPGAPAVNVDGMLTQAWGAIAYADNIDHEPLKAVQKALKEIRYWNRNNTNTFFHTAHWLRGLQLRLFQPLMPMLLRKWTYLGSTVDARATAT